MDLYIQFSIMLAFLSRIVLRLPAVRGDTCYSCQYSQGSDQGRACVYDPSEYELGPPTVGCATKPCMMEIQTNLVTGAVYFLKRGCEDTRKPGCKENRSFKTCIEICKGDLCNSEGQELVTPEPTTTIAWRGKEVIYDPEDYIQCYSCQYSYNPTWDTSCVDAEGIPSISCAPNRVCTVHTQYDKYEKVIRSFNRGCEEPGFRTDNCVEDTHFKTCSQFCQDDFCNTGDGWSKETNPNPWKPGQMRKSSSRDRGSPSRKNRTRDRSRGRDRGQERDGRRGGGGGADARGFGVSGRRYRGGDGFSGASQLQFSHTCTSLLVMILTSV